jgi:hypothetical protein
MGQSLQACLELAALVPHGAMLPVEGDPALRQRPGVWARARIAELLRKATPAQRRLLDSEIERSFKEAKGEARWRALAVAFGPDMPHGRQARFRLAQALADGWQFLEADLRLREVLQAGDGPSAARALLELARLSTRSGQLQDALFHYRLLARRYPKTVVEEGKTGEELLDELATDKRFLPYLEDAPVPAAGRFSVAVEDAREGLPPQPGLAFAPDGPVLPMLGGLRLLLRDDHRLAAVAPGRGDRRWEAELTRTPFARIVSACDRPHRARFSYTALGPVIVLPLGPRAFGIEAVRGRVLWEHDLAGPGEGDLAPRTFPVAPHDLGVEVTYAKGWSQRLGAPLAAGPATVCLQGRTGLVGLDPLTGLARWSRTDVAPSSHVFGDGENAYVVALAGGAPSSTRAVRLADGAAVEVKDFTPLYKARIGAPRGNRLLLSEEGAKGEVVLRLYDVARGKDVWRQTYPAGSTVLNSQESDLAGAVAPDGSVRVGEWATGKEVLRSRLRFGKVAPKDLPKARAVYVLGDRDRVYVVVDAPVDRAVVKDGRRGPLLRPGSGLRALPVNGDVYAFDRAAGKLAWVIDEANQTLLLERFAEMPVAVFTTQYAKAPGPARVAVIRALNKRNGKYVYHSDSAPAGVLFEALRADERKGRFDLLAPQFQLHIQRLP